MRRTWMAIALTAALALLRAPTPALAAAGDSTLSVRAHIGNVGWTGWVVGGGSDAGTGLGRQYQAVQLRVNRAAGDPDGGVSYAVSLQYKNVIGNTYSNGATAGTTGERRAVEDVRVWLTGTLARCYGVRYEALMSSDYEVVTSDFADAGQSVKAIYGPWRGKTFTAVDGSWTHISPPSTVRYKDSKGNDAASVGGAVGVRRLKAWLYPRSYAHKVRVRRESADGSWGDWEEVRSSTHAYASEVPGWEGLAADGTHEAAAGFGAYVAGWADATRNVDVRRKTATVTFRWRLQAADGSWPEEYEDGPALTGRVGETVSWESEADPAVWLNQAASATVEPAASGDAEPEGVDVYMDVPRRSAGWALTVRDKDGAAATDASVATCSVTVNSEGTLRGQWAADRASLLAGSVVTIGDVRASTPALRVAAVEAEGAELTDNGDGSWTLVVGAGDVALTIRTEANGYTVAFDAQEATQGVPEDLAATCGEDVGIPALWPQRDGWAFQAWLLPGDGGTCSPGDTVPALSDRGDVTVTLTALWSAVLRVRVPVAIHYVAGADGRLRGPSDGIATIRNDGATAVEVSHIRVEGADGVRVVGSDPDDSQVTLTVRPGEGTAIELGDYAGMGRAPAVPDDWRLGVGGSLALNGLLGRLGGIDLASERAIGAIHWTFRSSA